MRASMHAGWVGIILAVFATLLVATSVSASPITGPRTSALTLFDYAMGMDGSNSCLSCSFLSFFMVALSDFSFLLYQYFYDTFLGFAPAFLAIWLGWRAAKLMIMGGEDGKEFLYNVVGKAALFSMLWLFATAANNDNRFMWNISGPAFLEFSFSIANDIRDSAIASTTTITAGAAGNPMLCQSVATPAIVVDPAEPRYMFIAPAMQAACFTERAHMLGIASGVALALDSYGGGASFGWSNVGAWGLFLVTVLLKIFIGVFIITIYAVSAIWLIFLTLDIVTRGLITAAFSPILVLLYTYKPTRQITVRAITSLAGAMMTAVALAIISVLAFVLVTNTVNVYEATKGPVNSAYQEWDADEVPGAVGAATAIPSTSSDRIGAMRAFIAYIGVSDPDAVRVPMDMGTPWFWYMIFSGVAIFGLGKKIIRMLEDAVGYSGSSEFANSALKSIKIGMVMGGAATAGTILMAKGGAMAAGKAGSLGGGMIGGMGGQAMQSISGSLYDKAGKLNSKNVLSAAGMTMRAAQDTRLGDQ